MVAVTLADFPTVRLSDSFFCCRSQPHSCCFQGVQNTRYPSRLANSLQERLPPQFHLKARALEP